MWKTIDDVNATLDALSLINRGQPTTSGLNATLNKITGVDLGYASVCGSEASNNAVINNEQENSAASGYTLGRGTFIKELAKKRAPADKDAALKAELDRMFPAGFSNEAIERHWSPLEKVEKDQFEDAAIDELIEKEANIRFAPTNLFIQEEFEIRRCSPPLIGEHTTDIKSSSHDSPLWEQESGIVEIQPISDNSLNNLEYTISDNDSEQSLSLSLINDVTEEKIPAQQLPVLRPKKCRNALLNSLNRRTELLGKEMKEIKQPIVLKTPSDFIVLSSINANNISNSSSHEGFYNRVLQQSKSQQQKSDSDSFEYCEDDFPAL